MFQLLIFAGATLVTLKKVLYNLLPKELFILFTISSVCGMELGDSSYVSNNCKGCINI